MAGNYSGHLEQMFTVKAISERRATHEQKEAHLKEKRKFKRPRR